MIKYSKMPEEEENHSGRHVRRQQVVTDQNAATGIQPTPVHKW